MKPRVHLFLPVVIVVASVAAPVRAAEVVKAANTTNMNTGASWDGGVVPTAADTIVFNDVYTLTNTTTTGIGTGGPLTYRGIRLEGTTQTGLVTIHNTTTANHVAVGAGGVDMSGSPRNFQVASLQVDADQTWRIGALGTRTFNVGGSKLAGGGQVTVEGPGQLVIGANNTLSKGFVVGTARIQTGSAGGFGTAAVTQRILNGGGAYVTAGVTIPANFEIQGQGWDETSGKLGAIRLAGSTLTGNIRLTDDARITAHGSTGTLSGVISDGGSGYVLDLANLNTATDATLTVSGTAPNTYGGGTLVTGAIVRGLKDGAFGSGPVTVQSAGAVARSTRLQPEGITLNNSILLDSTANTNFRGVLHAGGTTTSTINGSVTLNAMPGNGGHLGAENATTAVLRVMGAVNVSGPVTRPVVRIGTVELGGGGNYTEINHAEGVLRLAADSGIKAGANLASATSGATTFDLNGFDQTLGVMTAGGFVSTLTNSHASELSVLSLTGDGDSAIGVLSAGAGGLTLNKGGNGTLRVTGTSTGAVPATVNVNGGALAVTGKLGGSATRVSVGEGAGLAGEGVIGGDLALGQGSGARLEINGETSGSLLVEGNVTVNGVIDVRVSGGVVTSPMDVLGYVGTLNANPANFTASRLRGATFQMGSGVNGTVTLSFAAPVNLVWTGSVNNQWDAGAATNWVNSAMGVDKFYDFDSALFTDAAQGTGEIALAIPSGVSPGSVTFNNSLKDFRITGPGALGGGSLTKAGTGTVTLATAGTFTGFADVTGGTLVLDFSNGNPASAAAGVQVGAGATLRLVHDDGAFTFDRALSGEGTVVVNPHRVVGSATAHGVNLTGANGSFAGGLVLASPASGTARLGAVTPTGLGAAVITVQNGNQLYAAGNLAYSNDITLTGEGFADGGGFLGALRLDGGAVWNGNVQLTGVAGDSGGTVADAAIGTYNGTVTVNGGIRGGDLMLVGYNTSDNETFVLSGANDYGDTIVRASDTPTGGQVTALIGATSAVNTTGTLGKGRVYLVGGTGGEVAALRVQRADGYVLVQDVVGVGNKAKTALLVDTLGAGFSTGAHTIDVGEQIRVGGNLNGAVLNIGAGAKVNAGWIYTGNAANNSTVVNQSGGDVVVAEHVRIAHWPSETSVWNMSGGSLTLLGVPGSPTDGGPGIANNEAPGMLYVGVDGQGVFNQTGGTVSAYGVVLDNRGNTGAGTNMATGTDAYHLNGGVLNVGPSGIRGNVSTAFNLGGGTLKVGGDMATSVPFTVTGPGSVIDTNGSVVALNGGLAGSGSLVLADSSAGGGGMLELSPAGNVVVPIAFTGAAGLKLNGSGVVELTGASSYTGPTQLTKGTLRLSGSLSGTELTVDGGVLMTGGVLAGNLRLSPTTYSTLGYGGRPFAVTGNVVVSGPVEVDPLAAGPLAAGVHPLITATGTVSGASGLFSLPFDFVASDYRQTFGFSVGAGAVNLSVVGDIGNLEWAGSGDWELKVAGGWVGGAIFYQSDAVRFADTATSGAVNLIGELRPSSVVVDNATVAYTFSGTGSVAGGGSLVKKGSGVLAINNPHTFSGGTRVEGGRLDVGAVGALGSGSVVVSKGTLRVVADAGIPATQTIVLGDAATAGADTVLELPVNATTTGDKVTLSAPLVVAAAPGAKAVLRFPGGTSGAAMTYNGAVTLDNRDLHLENTSDLNPNVRLWNMSGRISGTGDLHIDVPTGAARVRLTHTANDFNGDVYINSGHMQLGSGAGGTITAIPDGSDVIVASGATFAMGAGDTIAALKGAGEVRANLSSATSTVVLTVGATNASGVFDGRILDLYNSSGGGRVALTKTGTGTQVMNGALQHLGATTVNGGVLEINGTCASPITVNATGTLRGNGTLNGGLTATAAGSNVSPGSATGTLTVSGAANLGTAGNLVIDIDESAPVKSDKLAVSGSLAIGGATLTVNVAGTASAPVYVVASYGSLTGTFATVNAPAGFEVDYNYQGGNQIALVRTQSDYDAWAGSYALDPAGNGGRDVDADADGLTNKVEYAFGLNPASGGSASPVVSPLNRSTGVFTYKRRNPVLTGFTYGVETSATLAAGAWTADATAVHTVTATDGDIQTVQVQLSGTAPLAPPKLFVRVVATAP